MTNREKIQKVNQELRYGDKKEIAKMTSLSNLTVNRFFNGKEEELIEDTHSKIMNAALTLIHQRRLRAQELNNQITKILG